MACHSFPAHPAALPLSIRTGRLPPTGVLCRVVHYKNSLGWAAHLPVAVGSRDAADDGMLRVAGAVDVHTDGQHHCRPERVTRRPYAQMEGILQHSRAHQQATMQEQLSSEAQPPSSSTHLPPACPCRTEHGCGT